MEQCVICGERVVVMAYRNTHTCSARHFEERLMLLCAVCGDDFPHHAFKDHHFVTRRYPYDRQLAGASA